MIEQEDRSAVELAAALRDDYESLCGDACVPPAGLVWWRSTIRARGEAARTAERPIAAVQWVAAACGVALALAAGGAALDALPDLVVNHAMLLAAAAAACFVAAPIAVLVALGE